MEPIEITPTSLLIIGAISLFLGMLATLLLNSLREDAAAPDDSIADTPPGGRKGKYSPVARLWREKGTGKLVVEMDGKSLVTPEPLNNVQRERLEKAERDFRAWLGMGIASISEAAPVSPPPVRMETAETSTAPAHVPPTQTAAAPAQPVVPAVTPPSKPAQTPSQPIPSTPPPAVTRVAVSVPGTAPVPPRSNKSIVEQIEDILQDMLASTPYASRGIHLHQDPTRGVMVQVGLDYYEGIDSVPDPEIKAILKSAVAMWEQSQ